ncbi:MAG: cyclophilin-like fold protein [Burkholderiaceae bacterium]
MLAATCVLLTSQEGSSQQGHLMRLRLTVNGAPLAATLYDNAASRDLLKLLPLELALEDYASAEKIAYLPRKLDTTGAPAGFDPAPGDLTYYAPWGNLAVFYRDQPFAKGLVSIGRIEAGVDALKVGGPLKVTIEAVK